VTNLSMPHPGLPSGIGQHLGLESRCRCNAFGTSRAPAAWIPASAGVRRARGDSEAVDDAARAATGVLDAPAGVIVGTADTADATGVVVGLSACLADGVASGLDGSRLKLVAKRGPSTPVA